MTRNTTDKNKNSLKAPVAVSSLQSWFDIRRDLKHKGQTIGFVPTMGALHQGHASLLRRSRDECDITVLSIYVNPTQFNNPDDLAKYPSTHEVDHELAAQCGVDFILYPSYAEIYPDLYNYKITEANLSPLLCGAHRPGHFDGVLTVVAKLLNIVQPTRAYFGAKDFQQLQLVRGMVAAFFMDVDIVEGETVRENDGLAMSSRNLKLSSNDRKLAPRLYQTLQEADSVEQAQLELKKLGFKVDYVVDLDGRRFGAAYLGLVRLIDNVQR